MHDEIVANVAEKLGTTPWYVEAVINSVFTGIQQISQHPELCATGVELGPLMKFEVNYYYTMMMMHRLLMDDRICSERHPADNYTVVDKWQMIQHWEKYYKSKAFQHFREQNRELLDIDYSKITPEYDEYLMEKRKQRILEVRKSLKEWRKERELQNHKNIQANG